MGGRVQLTSSKFNFSNFFNFFFFLQAVQCNCSFELSGSRRMLQILCDISEQCDWTEKG